MEIDREQLTFEIAGLVDRLYHATNAAIADRLRAAGHPEIRPHHGVVFELVGAGARVTDLANRAGMTKQSMGELVDRLERLGYLDRVADPADGRARLVRLTYRGRAAAEVAGHALLETYRPWSEAVDAETGPRLARAMEQLVVRIERAAGA